MRTKALPMAALAASLIAILSGAHSMAADKLTEKEAAEIGTDAYIFGYPLVTMEFTRRVMTNATEPGGNHAPMGQFYNAGLIQMLRLGMSLLPMPTRCTRPLGWTFPKSRTF